MNCLMRQTATLLCGVLIGVMVFAWLSQGGSTAPAQSSVPAGPVERAHFGDWLNADGVKIVKPLRLQAEQNLYDGVPARNPDGTANAIVEIPAGTNAKWEVQPSGLIELEIREGAPRIVKFLPYPGNYGMIPSTLLAKELGGDGDAIDVLILGPILPRGSVAKVHIIGVLKFLDGGEQDDKLLAVTDGTPLAGIRSLKELDEKHPEASAIVLAWFKNYKGPGKMEFLGWGDAEEANALLDRAAAAKARK